MAGIADGDDALEMPFPKDVFLQRHQSRGNFIVNDALEFQVWSYVVVLPLLKQLCLVFFGIARNFFAICSLS